MEQNIGNPIDLSPFLTPAGKMYSQLNKIDKSVEVTLGADRKFAHVYEALSPFHFIVFDLHGITNV